MIRLFLSLICFVFSTQIMAQMGQENPTLDMSSLMWYVFPLFLLMFTATALFIQKILKPSFSSKYIYVVTLVGLLGAFMLNKEVQHIEDEQITEEQRMALQQQRVDLSDEVRNKKAYLEEERKGQQMANFWVIAIPNLTLIMLSLMIDGLQYQRRKEEK